MRIAHIVNDNAANITGDLVQTLYLAAAQNERGHSVTVITDQPSGMLGRACHQHGIPVTVVAGLKDVRTAHPVPEMIAELTGLFRSLNPELIHCHSLASASQAIPAGNRINVPCLLTLHAVNPDVFMDGVRGSGLRFATIAVCRAQFELLKRSGVVPEGTLHYVPHGTKSASSAPEPKAGESHRPNLVLVGSLSFRKGIDIAILVMADLRRRQGKDCPTLNIYGQGLPMEVRPEARAVRRDTRTYFEEMVSVLELGDVVHFCGLEPDVLGHCPSTDILLMPSRQETGPLVVLEAMSRGMPIVAADVGEVAEMLPDQQYGRIVPVESVTAFTDAIESLLSDIANGQFDPDLLIERHRSVYTSEKVAERVEAIYKQVLLNSSPPQMERPRRPVTAD